MLRRRVWLLVGVLLLFALAAVGVYRFVMQRYTTSPDDDYAAVQGDWRVVAWGYRDEGVGPPSPPFDKMIFTIRGNQIASRGDGKAMTFRLSGDGHDPKPVDLMTPSDPDADPGVYRLDGDTLTACFANRRGGPRPTDVLLQPGSDAIWLVKFQRVPVGQ